MVCLTTGVLAMPKQQIEADIADTTENYTSLSVPIKHPLKPIQTNAPKVLPEHITKLEDKVAPVKHIHKPFTKKEESFIEKRQELIAAFNDFQEKCTRGIWRSGLNVSFDVWWFINGKTYNGAGKNYDVYRELVGDNFTNKGLKKLPKVFYSLDEFRVEDFKSKSNYTAVFLFDPPKSGKTAFEVRLDIVDNEPTTFVFRGSYAILQLHPNTDAVDLSKPPMKRLVEIHGHIDNRTSSAPLLTILEQPYF